MVSLKPLIFWTEEPDYSLLVSQLLVWFKGSYYQLGTVWKTGNGLRCTWISGEPHPFTRVSHKKRANVKTLEEAKNLIESQVHIMQDWLTHWGGAPEPLPRALNVALKIV